MRTYTADGLLETITSDHSQWTTTYNKRCLSTNETLRRAGVDYPIGYTHSRNGHVAGMTYPGGTSLNYEFLKSKVAANVPTDNLDSLAFRF